MSFRILLCGLVSVPVPRAHCCSPEIPGCSYTRSLALAVASQMLFSQEAAWLPPSPPSALCSCIYFSGKALLTMWLELQPSHGSLWTLALYSPSFSSAPFLSPVVLNIFSIPCDWLTYCLQSLNPSTSILVPWRQDILFHSLWTSRA